MITCVVEYDVQPEKLVAFETYGRLWLKLVPRFGGVHHGYFLPSEGDSDKALALFSFPSLAAYEQYREAAAQDADVKAAVEFMAQSGCVLRWRRRFFRPLLPETAD
jgi:NIPSNAP